MPHTLERLRAAGNRSYRHFYETFCTCIQAPMAKTIDDGIAIANYELHCRCALRTPTAPIGAVQHSVIPK